MTDNDMRIPDDDTPGYYLHYIRENTDDEARIKEVHGGE